MKWTLLLLAFVACAPAAQLETFRERQPDPILDQGAHRAPVEWWYLNGHLSMPRGQKSFAAAIFQVLIPAEAKLGLFSLQALFPQPFFFGHFSLLDHASGSFRIAEKSTLPRASARVATKVGRAEQNVMDVQLADWRIAREQNASYHFVASLEDGTALELNLEPERPEVAHGPGWSGSTALGRMYYYSATRLRATGQLGGEEASGIAWLDHQWGGGDGDGGASITPRWDWLSLQLEDGRDLMVYRFRDRLGQPSAPLLSIVEPDGRVHEVTEFVLSPWRFWTAPSGAQYPVAWFLRLPDGTSLTVRAVVDDQEVRAEATAGFSYYEGAVRVTGTSRGVGYMELTGYGQGVSPFVNPFAVFGSRP